MQGSTKMQRSRLLDYEEPSLAPFVRAESATDCSIYWCGVAQFPMSAYERAWQLEFLGRLAQRLKEMHGLREETFLQTKVTLPDLMDLFLKRSHTYVPVSGMTLIPGTEPVRVPKLDEMRKATQKAGEANEPLDVNKWMPDHAHFFLDKSAQAQRDDFFGRGGMFSVLLKPDPKVKQTLPALPRIMSSHPAYSGSLPKQYEMAQSFKDNFLAQSKVVFGEPLQDDPSFEGLPFVLPLFTATSLLDASPTQRESWFEVFDVYWIESKPDKGLLLVCKDPDFDAHLLLLLEEMRLDGHTYRSAR
jgi:hypothetical protein